MKLLEVFFDYACPSCMRGHEILMALLPEFPDIDAVYRPCESHPRPERYGRHSDLCIRAMFFARDNGADMDKFHQAVYEAIHKHNVDVEDAAALSRCLDGIVDGSALLNALNKGAYLQELDEANSLAYDKSGVWVVPAYRMEGRALNVIEDVGITKERLQKFLKIEN